MPRHARSPEHATRTSSRRVFARLGMVVAALVSMTLLTGFGYGWYEYRSLDKGLHRVRLPNLAREPSASPGARHTTGQEQNILLVGLDSRDGLSDAEKRLLSVGNETSTSTDTIVIVHVPADGSTATMISIPRDAYVDIPGYLKNKINAAYADAWSDALNGGRSKDEAQAAGMDKLVATVRKLTGLRINHYVQVGFDGFYRIAKALHGIPVNLCAGTDDTLAFNETQGNGRVGSNFKMSAGKHDLTPVQALQFVRQRHNLHGGDLAREKRQQYFIKAAFDKIASAGVLLDPGQLSSLVKAVAGAFTIDDDFNLTDLAGQLVDLSSNKITGFTIPTEGGGQVEIAGRSAAVELVDPAKVRAKIAEALGGRPSGTATPRPAVSHPSHAPATHHRSPTEQGCIA